MVFASHCRALDLAVQYRVHSDTVLFFRNQYLASMGRKETLKRFIQLASSVNPDVALIKEKVLLFLNLFSLCLILFCQISQESVAERRLPGYSEPADQAVGGILATAVASSSFLLNFELPVRVKSVSAPALEEKSEETDE